MHNFKLPIAIVMATLLAASAWAAENAPADSSPEMPMMQQGGMMTPEAMMQMMAKRNQQMQMMNPQMMQMMPGMGYGQGPEQSGGYHPGMPMMGGGMGPMMMHPQMMGGGMNPMMMHPQSMGGGMGQMMNPQMMQMMQMMQMRMQHMHNMEQRLQNIEALLQQLVDQGKDG